MNNLLFLIVAQIFKITTFFIKIFIILEKVNTKTLIHCQSSSSVAKRIKQNTFIMLNLSWKEFESYKEQILHKSEQP